MTLPCSIGMIGATLSLAVAIMGAFYFGKDILHPGFLYKVVFASWFSGIIFYKWATSLMSSYSSAVKQQIFDEIDSVVIDAPDLTDAEIELAVEGLSAKKMHESENQEDSDEE